MGYAARRSRANAAIACGHPAIQQSLSSAAERLPYKQGVVGSTPTETTKLFAALHHMMLRIIAPHFVAGIVRGGEAAPIIRYMKGWTLPQIRAYCASKGWVIEIIE